jgi:hypothetical protein
MHAVVGDADFTAKVDRIASDKIAYVWREEGNGRSARSFVLALDRVHDEKGQHASLREGATVAVRLVDGSEDVIEDALVLGGSGMHVASSEAHGFALRLKSYLREKFRRPDTHGTSER